MSLDLIKKDGLGSFLLKSASSGGDKTNAKKKVGDIGERRKHRQA